VYQDITDEIEKDNDSCIIDKPTGTEQLIKKINKAIETWKSKKGKSIQG
jgi:hypothetical protein